MERDIEELSDFNGSLKELKSIVDNLIREFGEHSTIRTDAGHNNVSMIVTLHKPKLTRPGVYVRQETPEQELERLTKSYNDYEGTYLGKTTKLEMAEIKNRIIMICEREELPYPELKNFKLE